MTTGEETIPQRARSGPVQRAERRRMILDLRAAGLTEEAIAGEMTKRGHRISQQGVHKILTNAMQNMAKHDQDDIRQIRQMDLYRLDQMLMVLWPDARAGNIKAIREIRQLLDQRARLLGTYAATKHEIRGQIEGVLSEEEREEIRRLEEAFKAASAPEIVDAEVVDDLPPGLEAGEVPTERPEEGADSSVPLER